MAQTAHLPIADFVIGGRHIDSQGGKQLLKIADWKSAIDNLCTAHCSLPTVTQRFNRFAGVVSQNNVRTRALDAG